MIDSAYWIAALSATALLVSGWIVCVVRRGTIRAARNEIERAVAAFENGLEDDRYYGEDRYAAWRESVAHLVALRSRARFPCGSRAPEVRALARLSRYYESGRPSIDEANDTFIIREKARASGFFDTVAGHPLNAEQREAVVRDEWRALVVAGAGTGKTATLAAKAAYLVHELGVPPEEILLLSFTRKAAREMQERVETAGVPEVRARTFHSFGLDVIGQAEGAKPSMAFGEGGGLGRFVGQTVHQLVEAGALGWELLRFVGLYLEPDPSAADGFETRGEYDESRVDREHVTLGRETVKSLEEVEIANFLLLHGVRYEYERPYEKRTASKEFGQYTPDFTLPDAGVYLEHFGVDRSGRPPEHYGEVGGRRYVEGMAWKRKLHRKHRTTLVETYSWQMREGVLFTELTKALRGRGVAVEPLTPDEVDRVLSENRGAVERTCGVLATFITLMRSSHLSVGDVRAKAERLDGRDRQRALAFLDVLAPVVERFDAHLRETGTVDFSTMLYRAVGYLREGRYVAPYRYVLVDEFQDVSVGRAEVLRALLEQERGRKLFAVGDDWQAIYRFTGGDLSLFVGFERFFGFTRRTVLETTYRFHDGLAAPSGRFVMKNPVQARKALRSPRPVPEGSAITVRYTVGEEPTAAELRAAMVDLGEARSVFVLGRYRFNEPGSLAGLRRGSRVDFITVHSAKGLEADAVVVVGLQDGTYGFPSGVADDPLLGLVLTEPDAYEHAEERRLFYVALTRARDRVVLLAPFGNVSPFVKELVTDLELAPEAPGAVCQSCGRGVMVARSSAHGAFRGCSRYPMCSHTEDGAVGSRPARSCPRCGTGSLRRRNGKRGPFYGCSGYPSCRYTEDAAFAAP